MLFGTLIDEFVANLLQLVYYAVHARVFASAALWVDANFYSSRATFL